ncbi:MAG: hypothetical protein K2H04_01775 [Bacteroidaceae bacterium]|nr:hypothetical protein [Bacteroidaceae bacterium]
MKKLLLMTAVALGCISASAQGTLTLNTYKGTDISKYAGKTMNVSVSRYIFNGWNTISLPFSMTEAAVNEAFGKDCKLERLAGVENDGQNIKLNFQNCKSEGLKANVPYILYYTGETGTKKIVTENVAVADDAATLTFTAEGTGETVTMACAKQHKSAEGLYGILAKDNAEAAFVNVNDISSGFYATRCYIQLSNGNSTLLSTNHISDGVTSINAIAKPDEIIDVYNISGVKVASQIKAAKVNNLQKGIYVVKGKKVLVK